MHTEHHPPGRSPSRTHGAGVLALLLGTVGLLGGIPAWASPAAAPATGRIAGSVAGPIAGPVAGAPAVAAATADQTGRQAAKGAVLRPGDRGPKVRRLQSRLHQLKLHSEIITGHYDPATRSGVRAFQRSVDLRAHGVLTQRTWQELLTRTEKPTKDALRNVYTPGRTLLGPGDKGMPVRRIQARLKQIQWYAGDVTGVYDARTVTAVKGFQGKRRIPVTGNVDRRTKDRLKGMTRKPTKVELFNIVPAGPRLDQRCLTGRVLCIDKASRSLRWVVDGKVRSRYDVRFGSSSTPTREGQFSVFRKSRDHVSSLYHSPMPFAMFFSGGQAVHYSPDFAANGYNGASHGCVNVRDYQGIKALYDQVRIGDKVVVYWS